MSTTPLLVNADVVFTKVEGESVLLDMKSGTYFGLDPIGTAIWELIASENNVEGIVQHMLREYDVEEERLRADVNQFLTSLKEKNILRGV